MKHPFRPILVGIVVPFVLGYLSNFLLFVPVINNLWTFINLALVGVWGYCCYLLADRDQRFVLFQTLSFSSFGFMLAMLLTANFLIGPLNIPTGVLAAAQHYFNPFFSLATMVWMPVVTMVTNSIHAGMFFLPAWVLLFLVSLVACWFKSKK